MAERADPIVKDLLGLNQLDALVDGCTTLSQEPTRNLVPEYRRRRQGFERTLSEASLLANEPFQIGSEQVRRHWLGLRQTCLLPPSETADGFDLSVIGEHLRHMTADSALIEATPASDRAGASRAWGAIWPERCGMRPSGLSWSQRNNLPESLPKNGREKIPAQN